MVDIEVSSLLGSTPRYAAQFAKQGWVQIPNFLATGSADALADVLASRPDWNRVFNVGDKVMNIGRANFAALGLEERRKVEISVYGGARKGFQFRYENIRVPDDGAVRKASDDPLCSFAEMLSNGATRDVLRKVTSARDIAFADAQATAYAPGDFLTRHDDKVDGKNRRAAYVFGLTPDWRAEWGGILLFHDKKGQIEHGLVPAFNVLNIFSVPKVHSVSEVTRSAPRPRYGITGWLRSS